MTFTPTQDTALELLTNAPPHPEFFDKFGFPDAEDLAVVLAQMFTASDGLTQELAYRRLAEAIAKVLAPYHSEISKLNAFDVRKEIAPVVTQFRAANSSTELQWAFYQLQKKVVLLSMPAQPCTVCQTASELDLDLGQVYGSREVKQPQVSYVELMQENLELRRRIDSLNAARIAYASEFPLSEDGEPDVGNIHANIRRLKSQVKPAN